MTGVPVALAQATAGTRWANVLPVPVGASTRSLRSPAKVSATRRAFTSLRRPVRPIAADQCAAFREWRNDPRSLSTMRWRAGTQHPRARGCPAVRRPGAPHRGAGRTRRGRESRSRDHCGRTSGMAPTNSRNAATPSASGDARSRSGVVMPVSCSISGRSVRSARASVENSPCTAPSTTRQAPISMIS